MSLETNSFEFGEFLLDAKEKVLLRHGQPLSITPKTFQLLQILVENHGHLVERNELLNTVWADSFVEEGNLTFTIRLLRKTLGDEKQNPRFVETVPKRGYRFIAEVSEIASNGDTPKTFSEPLEKNSGDSQKFKKLLLPAAAVLIFAIISAGFWLAKSKSREAAAPVLSAPFASEKLSTNGKVFHVIVSPDGKNVIYTNGGSGDKQSVWLRQLETGNNVEIIPASNNKYYGLALSPDGNFLYFSRSPNTDREQDIYRVSIFGGVPQKILNSTEGWMSISPDGKQISFVRCPYLDDDYCSLRLADAGDGKNERILLAHRRPVRIGDNKFAPDGKTIAFAAGQSMNGANEFSLREIDTETGAERELTAEKFFNIKGLAWLPDQSGLLITALKNPTNHYGIWQVSAENGNISLLTKDSESYSCLSLDKEAKILISTQVKQDFRLTVLNPENPFNQRFLANALWGTFAPDGKIVFSSLMSGNHEIWSINADGSGLRQLTNDVANDGMAVVAGDNKTIFFASNRTGDAQIWQMNADGSNQTQIITQNGGSPVFVSPDGAWLYYHHLLQKNLWRISLKTGEEQLVFDRFGHFFALSPDASQAAFLNDKNIEIVSLSDAKIVKTFPLPDEKLGSNNVAWMPDGTGIVYISADRDENYFLRRQPLDGTASQTIAALGNDLISSFAAAPDGKSFAVVKGGWRHDAVLLKGLK